MFARILAAFMGLVVLTAAAPTDKELLLERAQAAEAQVKYLTSLFERIQEDEKETAAYWARYIALPNVSEK